MGGNERDWLAPHGRGWTVLSRERVHDNPWFSVDDHHAVAPTGARTRYYTQAYKNLAVGVLPLHEDGSITLVGQWRFPFGTYSWELPEGGAPKGESALEGARRELREEAGLEAEDWRQVLVMQLSNASSDETAIGYLATRLRAAPRQPDATEELVVVRVPFAQALQAAVEGRIQDAITVAMLLRVHHMACHGNLPDGLDRFVLG